MLLRVQLLDPAEADCIAVVVEAVPQAEAELDPKAVRMASLAIPLPCSVVRSSTTFIQVI